jgi:hypothetical protein
LNSTPVDIEEVLARYLAGRLTASESDAFEAYVSEQPEICKELEQTFKLKAGLARLRGRGELDALLHARDTRRWVPYAAAAAVLLALLTSALWFERRNAEPAMVFLSPSAIAARHRAAAPILGSYVLVRSRGSAAVTDVPLPAPTGTVELRILPSDVSPGARCSVDLKRLDEHNGEHRSRIEGATAGADGYVKVYLDGSELAAGEYEVTVRAAASGAADADVDRFVIRVQTP